MIPKGFIETAASTAVVMSVVTMPHWPILFCLIVMLPQVSPFEQFMINAEAKRLAHAEWLIESNKETAKLLEKSKASEAAHAENLARFQQTMQHCYDDVPSYRMCPRQTPMHEQVLKAAGKCSNCSDSMCCGDVAATCNTVCGCNWRICSKCMQDWLEFDWEAESYEEDSDVQQEHKHIQFPATVPEHIAEKAEDEEGAAQQIDFGESQERVSPAACPFEQFDSPIEPLHRCTRQTHRIRRRPTSFRQLCAEAKVVEMLDPIVTSDISGDKDVKECEGYFYFILSIFVQTFADMCPFQEASPRRPLIFLMVTRSKGAKVIFPFSFQLLSTHLLACVVFGKPALVAL